MDVTRPGRRIVLGIFALSALLFVVFAVSSYYSAQNRGQEMQFSCPLGTHVFTVYDLMPLIVMASLVFGAGMYYLMAGRVEAREMSMRRNMDIMLRFLGDEERKVVKRLLESNGRMPQAELTRIQGLSKVRVHRIVKKLSARGIVETEKHGNTNVVTLAKEVMEGLA